MIYKFQLTMSNVTKQIVVIDVVGLELGHLNSNLIPHIKKIAEEGESAKMRPVFPSVTSTVQASILSGKYPEEHGIISNGLFDKVNNNVSFWEQSSNLVQARRIWDIQDSKKNISSINSAVLFWQNTMYSMADIVVTPRPLHMANNMIMWCYSKPVGYYDDELKPKFGEFALPTYWGPFASSKSSQWIAEATCYTLEKYRPRLTFTYIPHVDYSAQKYGKGSKEVKDDLAIADDIVGKIVHSVELTGMMDATQFIILSEYGFNTVSSSVSINLKLREAGLLSVRKINSKEYIDYEMSEAFAMVDHQVAHVYVKEPSLSHTVRILENVKGIDKVLSNRDDKKKLMIDNERTGDIIAISDQDKWFDYYWWYDNDTAPDFANTVDIHRKPGYDPLELFIDLKTKSIPLDTFLVKGSHGRPPNIESHEGAAFYASNYKTDIQRTANNYVECVDVGKYLIRNVT
jgi:predicted AlkP superfamily pyrophosphatase or phosphodiesterase